MELFESMMQSHRKLNESKDLKESRGSFIDWYFSLSDEDKKQVDYTANKVFSYDTEGYWMDYADSEDLDEIQDYVIEHGLIAESQKESCKVSEDTTPNRKGGVTVDDYKEVLRMMTTGEIDWSDEAFIQELMSRGYSRSEANDAYNRAEADLWDMDHPLESVKKKIVEKFDESDLDDVGRETGVISYVEKLLAEDPLTDMSTLILCFAEDYNLTTKEAEDILDYYGIFADYFDQVEEESCKVEEDTVKKKNGKWTNRGDDGKEHGEFNTKKEADKQRKAMFANGYKAEAVDPANTKDYWRIDVLFTGDLLEKDRKNYPNLKFEKCGTDDWCAVFGRRADLEKYVADNFSEDAKDIEFDYAGTLESVKKKVNESLTDIIRKEIEKTYPDVDIEVSSKINPKTRRKDTVFKFNNIPEDIRSWRTFLRSIGNRYITDNSTPSTFTMPLEIYGSDKFHIIEYVDQDRIESVKKKVNESTLYKEFSYKDRKMSPDMYAVYIDEDHNQVIVKHLFIGNQYIPRHGVVYMIDPGDYSLEKVASSVKSQVNRAGSSWTVNGIFKNLKIQKTIVDNPGGLDFLKESSVKKKVIEEGYGTEITTQDLTNISDRIGELIEMMDDMGVNSIHGDSNTYGIGAPFIGTYSGYIDLSNIEKYVGSDEDEEYYDEDSEY